MNYLKAPLTPSYEPIGRSLTNEFGQKETVVLHKNYWDYYDWLVDEGFDMDEWVARAVLIRPHDLCLSEHIMLCLWQDECNRYRNGQKCPPSSPPLGYEE